MEGQLNNTTENKMWNDARDNNECVSIYETAVVFNSRAFDLIRYLGKKCDIEVNDDETEINITFSDDGRYKINEKGKRINNPKILEANGLTKGKFRVKGLKGNLLIIDTTEFLKKKEKRVFRSSGRKWDPNLMRQYENSDIWENPKG